MRCPGCGLGDVDRTRACGICGYRQPYSAFGPDPIRRPPLWLDAGLILLGLAIVALLFLAVLDG